MPAKRVLRPDRLRRVPAQFSWIDQRLVREGYIGRCPVQALALYLMLVTVADSQGLSYYGDASICQFLSIPPGQLERARCDLIRVGLIILRTTLVPGAVAGAARAAADFRRAVGARSGKFLLTVRGDTRIPSFNSNSLAMRSSPHEGFSSAIWRISTCSSTGIGGRPGRDFNRQNSSHPARCQRISVSGRTTVSAPRQSKSCDSRVRAMRVAESMRRGFTPRSI